MVDIPGMPDGSLVRVLVLENLGPVHKGDHIVVVGGKYAISVDTSRQPGDPVFVPSRDKPAPTPPPAAPRQAAPQKPSTAKPAETAKFTIDDVIAAIKKSPTITSFEIGNRLDIPSSDVNSRSRITKFIQLLRAQNRIRIVKANGNNRTYAWAGQDSTESATG